MTWACCRCARGVLHAIDATRVHQTRSWHTQVGFCEKSDGSGRGWTRVGSDVAYFKNCRTYPRRKTSTTTDNRTSLDAAPYRKHDRHHYTLTFLVALPHPLDGNDDTGSETDSDVVLLSRSPKTRSPQLRKRRRKKDDRLFLAHCFPYTYSDLRNELVALDDCPGPAVVRRRRLCSTLAGNDCDLLTITNFLTRDPAAVRKRAGVVLTARVHPGESNAFVHCVEINFAALHAIDAMPARRRGGTGDTG